MYSKRRTRSGERVLPVIRMGVTLGGAEAWGRPVTGRGCGNAQGTSRGFPPASAGAECITEAPVALRAGTPELTASRAGLRGGWGAGRTLAHKHLGRLDLRPVG